MRLAVLSAMLLGVFNAAGCSRHSEEASSGETAVDRPPTAAAIKDLYDPKTMIEVKRLSKFPEELQSEMGVHSSGYARIAEVGENAIRQTS